MERVQALIKRLQEQLDQNNDISAMMLTAQLLQAELQHVAQGERPYLGSAKVAVVLPAYNSTSIKVSTEIKENVQNIQPEENETVGKLAMSMAKGKIIVGVLAGEPEPEKEDERAKAEPPMEWVFDAVREIPTLAHQSGIKEINDVIIENPASSLNDRLKVNNMELGDLIVEVPVRDLRRAIGINDRYVFLNELFRGDETMYERSIKTINNFRIYAEAQFWIERELKIKLGWDTNKDTVKLFDQLVKRRFS